MGKIFVVNTDDKTHMNPSSKPYRNTAWRVIFNRFVTKPTTMNTMMMLCVRKRGMGG